MSTGQVTHLERLRQKIEARELMVSEDVVALIEIAEAAQAIVDRGYLDSDMSWLDERLEKALARLEATP